MKKPVLMQLLRCKLLAVAAPSGLEPPWEEVYFEMWQAPALLGRAVLMRLALFVYHSGSSRVMIEIENE